MSFLPWEERTILTFSADFESETHLAVVQSSHAHHDELSPSPHRHSQKKPKLSAASVWNFLLSLTDNDTSSSRAKAGKLKHFQATDFKNTWQDTATVIGGGTSYTVERWTLEAPSEESSSSDQDKSKPTVVAVKRLNIFKHGRSEGSEIDSVTLQYSIGTVLKELRIITHPPLQNHRNIAAILGYRSESIQVAASGQQRSVDIALVAEFAQYGTLADFVAQRGDLDLLAKAHFMHDIASGLAALHECGIAHGDVKLDNALVFEDPFKNYIAKLSDFGHALVDLDVDDDDVSNAVTSEQQQWYLGTPLQNAPEIRPRGRYSAAPARTLMRASGFFKCDIFSYGLLAWELILDAARFINVFDRGAGSVAADKGAGQDVDALWTFLGGLPKDEFLRRALSSLEERSQEKDEGALVGTLRRVLEATLRDLPWERKSSKQVTEIFRELKTFRDDNARSAVLSKNTPRLSRLPPPSAELPLVLDENDDNFLEMPRAVQVDLIMQLQNLSIAANTGDTVLRRTALHDLAMCHMTGFGNETADVDKALDLLLEAAQLGSPKALSVVFRLHLALRGVVPEALWRDKSSIHPIIEAEKRLASLPPQNYFAERVRKFEKIFQQEALGRRYDILHKGQPIMTGISLLDAESVLSNDTGMEIHLEYLECLSQPGEADIPTIRGPLLHTAVRFGLLSLVRFLISLLKPSSGEHHLSIISPPKQEDLLIAACRGGQFKMLEFLLSEGAELSFQMMGTPLHWLIMFPIDEARKALDLLLSRESGKACLLIEVPSPRVKMQHFHLSGTPLEWTIIVNYRELMELLLAVDFDAKRENNLPALGWTDSTFRRAVASHLSDLIPILLPLELSYLESRPLFAAGARFLLAHGEGKHLPFGLFEISHSPNPSFFMALMHGSCSRAALDASIDAVLQAGICALDDIDPKGLTALAHAVRYAPCTMNTDIISSLISRSAGFGKKKPAWVIANLVAKRRDRVEGTIIGLLLESGVLPLSIEMVAAAVRTGNARIVAAILSFVDSKGKRFDVNTPMVDNDDTASLLHIALLAPNHAETMGLLLDYGADIEARWNNQTVLEATVCAPDCDGEAINMLISRGASLALDGFSLIHRAASLRSQVDGVHILYHLLKHEKARAFADFPANVSDGSTTLVVRPLEIACLAGNVDAVRALLSAGAQTEPEGASSSILDLAVSIGRRPQLSPRGDIDLNDEKKVYAWRLDLEEIVMMLLEKIAPGHERTLLHVAVHLGNYKRIVELVEREGFEVTRVDRNSMRPVDLLEDFKLLESDLEESESYVENLKKISDYLLKSFIADVNLTSYADERIEQMLDHMSTMTFESADEIAAKAEFDATLQEMKDSEDWRFVLSLGDGRESPSELETRCSRLLAERKQKQVLADPDSRTLRIMEVLFRAYYMQARYKEAEKIQYEVLAVKEAQLNEDDPLLHHARGDRSRILCQLERYDEALAYASGAVIKALDAFGANHLASLALICGLSIIEGSMGNYDKAIDLQRESLSIFENLEYEGWGLSRSPSFGSIELMCNLLFYCCKVETFDGVSRVAEKAATAFEFVETGEFLQAFEFLSQAAAILQTNKRFEDVEVIYTKTVDICTKKHGKSKSYCTRAVLERLSTYFLLQKKWKEAGVRLQQLLNVYTAFLDPDHPDKAKCMLNLAWALEKQERHVEAIVLQEQAVRSLEQTLGLIEHQTLKGRLGLCRNYRNVNQLEKSEIMGRLAVDGFKSLSGEDDQWTFSAEDELAATLSAEDKSDEALELRRRRVNSMVRIHSEVHEKTQYALVLLSKTLMRMERFEEAVEQSQRALQICLKIWGENSHLTSHCLYIQAKCKQKSGDTGEAAKLFTRSIETERVSHGGNNSETLTVMRLLGKLYLELEEYEKAEPLLRELLDEAPKIYGKEEPGEVQLATSHLGYICEMTDRQDEAIKHYQAAVRMARHMYGDSHDETIECLDDLVRISIDSGRMKTAHNPAVEILQYKSKTLGKYHEETIEAHTNLGIIYQELDMWPEAERMQRVVLRHLQSQSQDPGNPDNEDIIDAMATLVQSCRNQERYTEAEGFARHVLKHHVEQRGNEAEETLQSMIDLAYIMADSKQVAEAEQINCEVYATCERLFNSDHEQFIAAQSQHAYICYQQEKLEEAEKTQLLLLDRNPDDVVELDFLQLVYKKMKRYDQAFELCQKEISARRTVLGHEGMNNMQVLQAMTNMTNLFTAMERWSEAREHGERIRELVEKNRIEGNYQHDKTLLESMTALKPVYEALCEEDKLHDLVFQIQIEELKRKDRRKQNTKFLENDARRFEEFKAAR